MKSSSRTQLPDRPPLPVVDPDQGAASDGAVTDSAGLHQDRGGALLAELADCTDLVDRTMARIVTRLVTAIDAGLVETRTRLSTRVWLESVCRLPSGDARDLLGMVDVLRHLPATTAGLADGWLSWGQTRRICAAARTIAADRRGELDRTVDAALHEYRGFHPDELCDRIQQLADTWQPSRLETLQRSFEQDEFLVLQPQLEGGGSLYGQWGPTHFATIAEALDTPLPAPTSADLTDPDQAATAVDRLDEQRRQLALAHRTRLGRRLVDLCEAALSGTRADGQSVPPRPNAYVVTTLDALCDRDATPGWLLHTLAGGRMRMTAASIRRLIDARGADLRTIVLDDTGQALGVGRKTRIPPGWLRDTIMVRDLHDRSPGGRTPVRRCDLDHLDPWEHGGHTDAHNLQAIGRRGHTTKTRGHWTVTPTRDGTTTWRHPTTGVTVRRPPTWHQLDPPPGQPSDPPGDPPGDRPDPPGDRPDPPDH